MFITQLSDDVSTLTFAIDNRPEGVRKDFPLERMSLDEVKKHPEIKLYNGNSLKTLMALVIPVNPDWQVYFRSPDYFNALFKKEKSRILITEIANVFSSLVDKNYMIGNWKNTRGGFMDVNYFEAKGAGLAKSITSSLRRGILSLAEVDYNNYEIADKLEDLNADTEQEVKPDKSKKGKKKKEAEQAPVVNNRLAEALAQADIESIIKNLKSDNKDVKATAFERMLNVFGLNKIIGYRTFRLDASSPIWQNSWEFLEALAAVTPDKTAEQINDLLSNQKGRLSSISKAVKTNTELERTTSITDGRNNRIYKLVPGSFFYDIAYQFVKTSEGKSVQEGSFMGGEIRRAGIPGLAAATGPVSQLKSFIPSFLTQTEYYMHNIFVGKLGDRSIQKIYGFQEHDSQRNFYSFRAIPFESETDMTWNTRKFSMGFLSKLNGGSVATYHHFLFQPADRPRIPSLEIRILNTAETEQAVMKALDQLRNRNHGFLSAINKAYKKEKFFQFSIAKQAIKNVEGKQNLTDEQVYEIFEDKWGIDDNFTSKLTRNITDELFNGAEATKFVDNFIKSGTIVEAEVGKIYANILKSSATASKFYQDRLFDYKLEGVVDDNGKPVDKYRSSSIPESTKVSVKNEANEYNEQEIRELYEPLLRLFFMNNYVNSYHVNQLFTGAYDEFKNSEDMVKRMTGVLAPGIKPFIAPWAARTNYNVGFIRDNKLEVDAEGNIPQQMLDFVARSAPNMSDERKRELLSFFRKVETTDGQGFISRKRMAELKVAYGQSYNVGNILKPVYFGTAVSEFPYAENLTSSQLVEVVKTLQEQYPGAQFDQFFTIREQDGLNSVYKKEPRTVYIKYSAVHLDESLLERYPELAAFDKYMEDNNIDELVFPSAVKIGAPSGNMLTNLDAQSLIDHYLNEDRTLKDTSRLTPDENGLSIVSLENKFYRMQFNPISEVGEQKVTNPSQLPYFTNLFDYNSRESQVVFDSITDLIRIQTREAIRSLTGTNNARTLNRYDKRPKEKYRDHHRKMSAIEKKIKSSIAKKLTSPGSEYYKDFLEAGVSMSNPILYDKIYSQIMSTMENGAIRIKLPGGKMIMQSDVNVRIVDKVTGEVRELQSYDEQGKYYSEVVVSRDLLDQDMIEAIESGEDVYASAQALGFRIPTTELHSAIPMKIVGIHDDQNTNLVIAPFNTVYILGADFDVDSLFVVKRAKMPKSISDLLGVPENTPVGYRKIKGRFHFIEPRLNPTNNYDGAVYNFPELNFYLEKLNTLIEEEQTKIKTSKEQAKPQSVIDTIKNTIEKYERYKETLRKLYAKNAIFEAYSSAVQKPETRGRMLTPILMSTFNDQNDPRSVAGMMSKLNPKLWSDDLLGDLTNLNVDKDAFSIMQSGKKLTGHFANAIKVLAYISKAGPDGKNVFINSKNIINYSVGKQVTPLDRLDNSERLWILLDALVNLAIDNLKEFTLGRLNITAQNSGSYTALLAVGMPAYDASLIFKSSYVAQLKNITSFNYTKEANNLLLNYAQTVSPELAKTLAEEIKTAKEAEGGFETVIDRMLDNEGPLSREELEKLVVSEVENKKPTKANFITMLKIHKTMTKARSIGRDIALLSWAMAPIRGLPNDEESALRFQQNVGEIFQSPDFSRLKEDSAMTPDDWAA
jgi:hypothetical protein